MSGQATQFNNNQEMAFDQASLTYYQSQVLRLYTDVYISDFKKGRKNQKHFFSDLRRLKVQDAKSLLYIENFLINKSWENINLDDDDYRNTLILKLQAWNSPVDRYNELLSYKIQNVLPENYLHWFENDLRCSLFLASLIEDFLYGEAYKGKTELITAISNYLRFNIHMFNCNFMEKLPKYQITLDIDGDQRSTGLLFAKASYLKNRTNSNKLKWIDATNTEQIEWAYNYLNREESQHIILKGIFFPENTQEKYELILASLDVLSNVEDPSIGTKEIKGFSPRAYVLSSIKKAWDGQKQYDSKSKVSEGSIKIYKKNQIKLEALMDFSRFTANKMINTSIEQLYDALIVNNIEAVGTDDASG